MKVHDEVGERIELCGAHLGSEAAFDELELGGDVLVAGRAAVAALVQGAEQLVGHERRLELAQEALDHAARQRRLGVQLVQPRLHLARVYRHAHGLDERLVHRLLVVDHALDLLVLHDVQTHAHRPRQVHAVVGRKRVHGRVHAHAEHALVATAA